MHHDRTLSEASCLLVGMWAPGIVGIVVGLALLVAVKDSPEKIGYPPVEIVKPKVFCFSVHSQLASKRYVQLYT